MDDCADVESKIGTMNLDTDYMIQGLELILSRLKAAQAGGWKMPSGEENKAFAVTMDETMCTNDVEQHLFRRIFAIAAYKEAKAKVRLELTTHFACPLVGWLVGWSVGWLVGWLVGWSVGRIALSSPCITIFTVSVPK